MNVGRIASYALSIYLYLTSDKWMLYNASMLLKTTYEHVVLDKNDVPYVADTNTKVIEIVLDKLAYGWSTEEMHLNHPHLSLGQIHSALAYYWDHQEELDAAIASQLEFVETLRKQIGTTPLVKKLRAQGLID